MAGKGKKPGYEVGYGRPPKDTQFKKGQSGNPKGRPPAVMDLGAAVRELLKEAITVREGDRTRTVSKAMAVIQTMVVRSLKGDPRATDQVVKMMREQRMLTPPEDRSNAPLTGVLIVPGMATDQDAWEREARAHMVRLGAVSDYAVDER